MKQLDPHGTPRSAALLSRQELDDRRSRGVPVAFDPAQAGWIETARPDDVDLGRAPSRGAAAVSLRPWAPADKLRYTALLDDPDLWETMTEPYPDPVTPALAADLITLSNAASHHLVRAVIVGGVPVGQVRLHHGVGPDGESELSYWIGRAHRGTGYATAASALLLDRHAGAVIARVRDDNPASRRVLDRLGFVRTGPDRDRPGWTMFARRRP
jgi:RimJ/RimL family protein N-acetyltransferase